MFFVAFTQTINESCHKYLNTNEINYHCTILAIIYTGTQYKVWEILIDDKKTS